MLAIVVGFCLPSILLRHDVLLYDVLYSYILLDVKDLSCVMYYTYNVSASLYTFVGFFFMSSTRLCACVSHSA